MVSEQSIALNLYIIVLITENRFWIPLDQIV